VEAHTALAGVYQTMNWAPRHESTRRELDPQYAVPITSGVSLMIMRRYDEAVLQSNGPAS
jgi:hypothetical protein